METAIRLRLKFRGFHCLFLKQCSIKPNYYAKTGQNHKTRGVNGVNGFNVLRNEPSPLQVKSR
jgi:hypothetical protein